MLRQLIFEVKTMRIFFSVGEPSGDLHGANLIRHFNAEDPSIECVGFGGPKMEQAGLQSLGDLTRFAVMFLWQTIWKLPTFYRLYKSADRYFAVCPVDAVVLIDYPGFNWWIAKAAKRRGITVFYYGVPQMWAWGSWRIRKLKRRVDHVICKLPFEKAWFEKRNCQSHFVGHPYFDELSQRKLDQVFIDNYSVPGNRLLTLLPGSRDQEVRANLTWMLEAAVSVSTQLKDLDVAIACYSQKQAQAVRAQVRALDLPFDVMHERTPELIHMSDVCLACSGSVSLELMYHRKPSVIVYRITALQWLLKRLFLQIPYVTLVNLLWLKTLETKGREIPDPDSVRLPFPEYARISNPAADISRRLRRLLRRPQAYQAAVERLNDVALSVEQSGATARAAKTILKALRDSAVPASQPQLEMESAPIRHAA